MELHEETKERESGIHGRWYRDACGTAFAMELVGERWALLIVRELLLGPRRFSDLRAALPGISAKVLTERLAGMEAAGVLLRRRLPPPAASRVYELTEWGRAAEAPILALGRWAAMSRGHDPQLPLSAAGFMLSLKTMFIARAAKGLAARIGFTVAGESFMAELAESGLAQGATAQSAAEGALRVAALAEDGPVEGWWAEGGVAAGALGVRRASPEEVAAADASFAAAAPLPLLRLFYGHQPLAGAEQGGVAIAGDRALAERFARLFALPAKLA